jgi:hypothetical protein
MSFIMCTFHRVLLAWYMTFRLAEHVSRMGSVRNRLHTGFWLQNLKDINVDGRWYWIGFYRNRLGRCGLNSRSSRQKSLVGFCQRDNERSNFIKCMVFSDMLSGYQLFKNYCSMEPVDTRLDLQVLTSKSMKVAVFWDVVPCGLVDTDRRFRGVYCLPPSACW